MPPVLSKKRLPLWKRRLFFRMGRWCHPVGVVRDRAMRWAYSDDNAPVIDGICIRNIAIDSSDEKEDRFVAYMRAALVLIQAFDPIRYRRVVRHLRFIVNGPCSSSARYEHETKACRIDFNKCSQEDEGTIHPWYVASFANSIVHEATHAYLMDRFIPYTVENRTRVERICIDQQNEFLTKLPKEPYDFVAECHNGRTDAEIEEWLAGSVAREAELRQRLWSQLQGMFRKKPL